MSLDCSDGTTLNHNLLIYQEQLLLPVFAKPKSKFSVSWDAKAEGREKEGRSAVFLGKGSGSGRIFG